MTDSDRAKHPDLSVPMDFFGPLGTMNSPITSLETIRGSTVRVDRPDSTVSFTLESNRQSTLGASYATFINVHGNMNILSQGFASADSESLVHLDKSGTSEVLVSLASCLKMAGIIVLVLVGVGVAANSSAAGYVVHPLFLAVLTVSGLFLILMSFGRPSR